MSEFCEDTLSKIHQIIHELDLMRLGNDDINIIDILRLNSTVYETAHSSMLKELLCLGKMYRYPFLKIFLAIIGLAKLSDFQPESFHCEQHNIDVFILGKDKQGNKASIIIENKINEASDQETQIERYIETAKNIYKCHSDNIYVLYLVSGIGKKYPTENSISIERRQELEDKGLFKNISYLEHILPFLDKILTSWNNENIRTAVFQYQAHIRNRFGQNPLLQELKNKEISMLRSKIGLKGEHDFEGALSFLNSIKNIEELTVKLAEREFFEYVKHTYKEKYEVCYDEQHRRIRVIIPFNGNDKEYSLQVKQYMDVKGTHAWYGIHGDSQQIFDKNENPLPKEESILLYELLELTLNTKAVDPASSAYAWQENSFDDMQTTFIDYIRAIERALNLKDEYLELKENFDCEKCGSGLAIYVPVTYKDKQLKLKVYFEKTDGTWYGLRLNESIQNQSEKIDENLFQDIKSFLNAKNEIPHKASNDYNMYWSYVKNHENPLEELKTYIDVIQKVFK